MSPLIPLALASEALPSTNRLSTASLPIDTYMPRCSLQSPSAPAYCLAASGRTPRPLSQPPPRHYLSQQPQDPLCVLPATAAEWKVTLCEIKRACVNKKYKQCSDRCLDILNNTKDLNQIQPAYLVYLHFYSATALEMQALATPHSSPRRLSLLHQARSYYTVASESAQLADETMAWPSLARRFSSLSSMHSPAGSDVSSAASTRLSSPPPSLCSTSVTKSKPQKRVSFRDVPFTEPVIRPDSPTLGFDDYFTPVSSSPVSVYPESILKQTPSAPTQPQPSNQETEQFPDPFFHARSIHRYCNILSGLRESISSHLTNVDTEIAALEAPHQVSRESLRSSDAFSLPTCMRIERLRSNGWRRPRFDSSRYEKLRRDALADLAE
ncbi:hypothetical protein CDD82_1370 [Ophiocordyceps australis]|uniref:Uncharacterized protein n=1 Tax=Ophiocordyceps australis TaxID=1399860 RepID=A0A2C5XNR3_9HYPO|nr:hypothetical protein CDD82_1370 [Ophiocordyceps australis]